MVSRTGLGDAARYAPGRPSTRKEGAPVFVLQRESESLQKRYRHMVFHGQKEGYVMPNGAEPAVSITQ